jgi:hypothetical protein
LVLSLLHAQQTAVVRGKLTVEGDSMAELINVVVKENQNLAFTTNKMAILNSLYPPISVLHLVFTSINIKTIERKLS